MLTKENRTLCGTYQIPGRKTSLKGETGWCRCRRSSVSPNNSGSEEKSWSLPDPPADRWSTAWSRRHHALREALQGEGSALATTQVGPGWQPPTQTPLSYTGWRCAEACLGWKLQLMPASLKSWANSNMGKREVAHQRQRTSGRTLWTQERQKQSEPQLYNTAPTPQHTHTQQNTTIKVNSRPTGSGMHAWPKWPWNLEPKAYTMSLFEK